MLVRETSLMTEARKQFNWAKCTGELNSYIESLTNCNQELRRSKRRTWRSLYEGINSFPATGRLYSVQNKDNFNDLGLLLKADGSNITDSWESMSIALRTPSPDFTVEQALEMDRD